MNILNHFYLIMKILVKTHYAVLRTLYQIQRKHRRTYSWVKRSTIRKYLKKFYGIDVCLSTVSYHLWIFNQAGIINSYTRYRHFEDGTFENLPSNRQITGKGIILLKRLGINVASWLYNWAFHGVRPARVIASTASPHDPSIKTRLPRRVAGKPETLKNTLSDTLNSLK
ncbi:hypothetical protein ES702_05666 [subsurface metagenome]